MFVECVVIRQKFHLFQLRMHSKYYSKTFDKGEGLMSLQTIKSIDSIRFSVESPSVIRKYSGAEITAPETYDEDGMSVQGGLMDGRLGTLEPGQKCLTCGNTAARCPGHFGHIELAEPVLHIA